MNTQRGATLFGMLVIGLALFFAAVLAFKLLPPYIEHWQIEKVLAAMAADPSLPEMGPMDVRASFDRRAGIDNIGRVRGGDLILTRTDRTWVASVAYPVKVHLFGNLSAWIDFTASTAPAP